MPDPRVGVFKRIAITLDTSECWPWEGAPDHGRPRVTYDGVRYYVYRLVWELTHGAIPDGQIVRHKCDNPMCCNPHHMELGTDLENAHDRTERERHGMPRHVTRAIRKLASEGRTHQEIADLYGIGRRTVGDIVNRKTHKER